ncbi:MAG: Carboxymethylenebutenolidase [bacterium]|nr:Carboxymethylenebutenolidase [bacterium]
MRASGLVLAGLITLTSAALIYHRAHPSVKTQAVQYQSGAETVTGFIAYPEGKGPFPAVILIHEWWGLNDWMKENAKKFADEGYIALAIDLYRGQVAADPDAAHELMRGLPEDRATRDLQAAFAYLVSRNDVQHDKIGSVGWCMGGGYSLQAALNIPELAAGVINYGRLVTDTELIDKINCPLLGIFGAKDRGIPVKDIEIFKTACKKAEKDITVQIYQNSGHAFINENNPKAYNAKDAKNAWEKTFSFLEKNLKD